MIDVLDRALAAWRALWRTSEPGEFDLESPADFTLGGKRFRTIDFGRRTVLIDHYLMRQLRGLDRVMPMDGEDDATWFARLQTAIVDSGRSHEILAGYLLPQEPKAIDEREWTPQLARATARHIALLDTESDRERVLELSMQAALNFFVHGVNSLRRSLIYSGAAASEATPNQIH